MGAAGAWRAGARARVRRDRDRAATPPRPRSPTALDRIIEELRVGRAPGRGAAGAAADPEPARPCSCPAATAAALGDGVPAALDGGGGAAAGGRRATCGASRGAGRSPNGTASRLAELLAGVHAGPAVAARLRRPGRCRAGRPAGHGSGADRRCPCSGILLGELVGAGPLQVLRSGVLGQVLVVCGVGLAAAGAAWARAHPALGGAAMTSEPLAALALAAALLLRVRAGSGSAARPAAGTISGPAGGADAPRRPRPRPGDGARQRRLGLLVWALTGARRRQASWRRQPADRGLPLVLRRLAARAGAR